MSAGRTESNMTGTIMPETVATLQYSGLHSKTALNTALSTMMALRMRRSMKMVREKERRREKEKVTEMEERGLFLG